jgi:hypothetical protein
MLRLGSRGRNLREMRCRRREMSGALRGNCSGRLNRGRNAGAIFPVKKWGAQCEATFCRYNESGKLCRHIGLKEIWRENAGAA